MEIKEHKLRLGKVGFFIIVVLSLFVVIKDVITGFPFHINFHIRYIDDLLVLGVYLFLLLLTLYMGKTSKGLIFAWTFIVVYIIASMLISISAEVPVTSALLGFRDNYWYLAVLMLIMGMFFLDRDAREGLISNIEVIIICYVIVQVAAVFIQQCASLGLSGKVLFEDEVTGTLGRGQAHILAYSLIMCFPYLLYRKKHLLLVLAVGVIFLASARAAILISAISLVMVLFLYRGKSLRRAELFRKKSYLVASIIFIVAGVFVYNSVSSDAKINLERIYKQQTRTVKENADNAGSRRIGVFLYATELLEERGGYWFGSGPASFASRSATYVDAPMLNEFRNNFKSVGEMLSGGSSLNVWFIEYGAAGGILLFIIPYLFLLIYLYRSGPPFFFSGLVFFLGMFANKLAEAYSTEILFWLIVGLAYLHNQGQPIISEKSSIQSVRE